MKVFVWSKHYPDYEDRMRAMSDHWLLGLAFEVAGRWKLVPKD